MTNKHHPRVQVIPSSKSPEVPGATDGVAELIVLFIGDARPQDVARIDPALPLLVVGDASALPDRLTPSMLCPAEVTAEALNDAVLRLGVADELDRLRSALNAERFARRQLAARVRAGSQRTELILQAIDAATDAIEIRDAVGDRVYANASASQTEYAGVGEVVTPVRNDDGGVVGTISIQRDRAAIAAGLREMVRSDRLAAVGQLGAGVAHEINNPLTYVLTNIEYVLRELSREELAVDASRREILRDLLDDARVGARKIRNIVRDLRSIARPRTEDLQPTNVHAVAELAAKLLSTEIRHRARLVTQLEETPDVMADRSRLAQVCVSLLNFALASAPSEGPSDHRIVLRTGRADDRVILSVSDTGPALSPDEVERIFDPFSVARGRPSIGLGLSIARAFIEEIGGSIQVESEPRRGTTFRVEFPACAPQMRPTSDTRVLTDHELSGARVLVVDDDPGIVRTLARLLHQHELVCVETGRDALIKALGEDFDVILCDVMMPDVPGMDVYSQLAEHRPGMEKRIVFITGGAFTEEARRFVDKVPNPVIEKPFEVETLAWALDQILVASAANGSKPEPA